MHSKTNEKYCIQEKKLCGISPGLRPRPHACAAGAGLRDVFFFFFDIIITLIFQRISDVNLQLHVKTVRAVLASFKVKKKGRWLRVS